MTTQPDRGRAACEGVVWHARQPSAAGVFSSSDSGVHHEMKKNGCPLGPACLRLDGIFEGDPKAQGRAAPNATLCLGGLVLNGVESALQPFARRLHHLDED